MNVTIKNYKLYERYTGEPHQIQINRRNGWYEVRLDDEFFSTAESFRQAQDEAVEIVIELNLTHEAI